MGRTCSTPNRDEECKQEFSWESINEINLIQTLRVSGAIISTPYTSSCCTKRHLISIRLPIQIPFRLRNCVLLYLLRQRRKLSNRLNICSKEEMQADMGTGHTAIFLQGEGKEAIIMELSKPHMQSVPLATEPGIYLIILTSMKILHRNLNRSTFVV